MNPYQTGFIKAAMESGCSYGEALDLLKYAVQSYGFQAPPPRPPIIDTVAPSTYWPTGNVTASGSSGFNPAGGSSTGSSWGTSPSPTAGQSSPFSPPSGMEFLGTGGGNTTASSAISNTNVSKSLDKPIGTV